MTRTRLGLAALMLLRFRTQCPHNTQEQPLLGCELLGLVATPIALLREVSLAVLSFLKPRISRGFAPHGLAIFAPVIVIPALLVIAPPINCDGLRWRGAGEEQIVDTRNDEQKMLFQVHDFSPPRLECKGKSDVRGEPP